MLLLVVDVAGVVGGVVVVFLSSLAFVHVVDVVACCCRLSLLFDCVVICRCCLSLWCVGMVVFDGWCCRGRCLLLVSCVGVVFVVGGCWLLLSLLLPLSLLM